MRETFVRELQRVQDNLLSLGSMVESGLIDAVDILKRRDISGSNRLIQWDEWVNTRRFSIEGEVLLLIARQQPVATDMRMLAAMLEIATELERIGDYAKGIARINLNLDPDFPHERYMDSLQKMSQIASHMIHEALKAFTWRDGELAQMIPSTDDELDDLYTTIYRQIIEHVSASPELIDSANNIMWAAHNLERAGDRAVNICERVVFTVTGEMIELSPS